MPHGQHLAITEAVFGRIVDDAAPVFPAVGVIALWPFFHGIPRFNPG